VYEYFIGLRHLRSRARASLSTIALISILGVCLGVAALVAVVSVTGGFQETFRNKVLGVNSHVLVMSNSQLGIHEYRLLQSLIEAELPDDIAATSPFIFNEMMIASESNLSGILIKGVDPTSLERVSDLPTYLITDGSADAKQRMIQSLAYERQAVRADASTPRPDAHTTPNMLMGKTLATKLKVKVGDIVQVVSPQHSLAGDPILSSGISGGLTELKFRVSGLYDSGFHDYDSKLVVVHYAALQDFFGHKDNVTGIEIRLRDIFQSTVVRDHLRVLLESDRAFKNYRIIDWKDLNRNLFTSLEIQKVVLTIIMTFIVIVASFNIVGTLIMLVIDKQKEIAILRSMGASDGGIMRVFIFQGLFIGAIGTLLGLALGYGLCQIIRWSDFGLDPKVYLIDALPVKVVPLELAIVGLSAVLISFFATLYPSWWATQLDPIEGLRYE
jgi:lipoprotein-releasing system permease protein